MQVVHSELPFSLADKGNCLKPRAVSVDVAVEQLLSVVFVPVGGLWTVTSILNRLNYENAPSTAFCMVISSVQQGQ